MFYNRANGTKKLQDKMGVFAGTERQCTEDEHDYQISEFGLRGERKTVFANPTFLFQMHSCDG